MNPSNEPNSAEMAEEVENERAGLVNTLDQLRENLRPENMVDEVFSQAKVNSSDVMDKVWGLARSNPIPAALIGLGAAMLASAGQRRRMSRGAWPNDRSDLRDPAIFNAASDVRRASAASAWTNDFDEPTDTIMDRDFARPRSNLSRLIEDQPFVLAALGIAVGAAIGSAIPSTQIEGQWLGDASETMRQNANAMAREQMAQLRSTASQTFDDMKATAAQHGVSSDNLSDLVHDLGEQAKKGAANLGSSAT